jgi:hypothetical protein
LAGVLVVVAVLPVVLLPVLPLLVVGALRLGVLPEPVVVAVLPVPVAEAGVLGLLLPVLLPLVVGWLRQAHLTPLSEPQGRPTSSYSEGCVLEGQAGAVSQLAGVLAAVAVLPGLLVVAVLPVPVVVAVLPGMLLPVLLPVVAGATGLRQAHFTP